MTSGAEAVARARDLVGVRFRPQGRSAATGLDCIGLAAAAVGAEGAPADYRLSGGSLRQLAAGLEAAGLSACTGRAPGDVLALRAGPAQLHLAVWTGDGIVHADAGLRRIVERPGEPPWPVIGAWRREG